MHFNFGTYNMITRITNKYEVVLGFFNVFYTSTKKTFKFQFTVLKPKETNETCSTPTSEGFSGVFRGGGGVVGKVAKWPPIV